MATKRKTFIIRIKPENCIQELKQTLSSIGKLNNVDDQKGIYKAIYRYGLQSIPIVAATREHKGITVVHVIGKTDDVFGTGADKAIEKIEGALKSQEAKYIVDQEVRKGFSLILKGQYEIGSDLLFKAQNSKSEEYKLNLGLGLYYAFKEDPTKAQEYLNKGLIKIQAEEQDKYRTLIGLQLFKLQSFQLAARIFEPVTKSEDKEDNILLFLLIYLRAGNIDQVMEILIHRFNKAPILFLKLYNDKSLRAEDRVILKSKSVPFIKSIRRNTIFTLSNNSIAFLIENKEFSLVSNYRNTVKLFYEKRNISIQELASIFNRLNGQVQQIRSKAIELLLEKNKELVTDFSNNVRNLSLIADKFEGYINLKEQQHVYQSVNDLLEKLGQRISFESYYEIIKELGNIIPSIYEEIEKIKVQCSQGISEYLDGGMTDEAEWLISGYKICFNQDPESVLEFQEKIKRIKLNRSISLGNATVIDKLKKYHDMLVEGLISEEDFEMVKKEILKG